MTWMHRLARRSWVVFLALGVAALGYAAYVTIEARAYQRAEARRFEQARAADAIANGQKPDHHPKLGELIGIVALDIFEQHP